MQTIPINYIRNFLSKNDNGKYATLRVGENTWKVKFLYYEHYSNVKFSHGWHEFVKGCGLKSGDVCHFRVIDKEKVEFQVTIN